MMNNRNYQLITSELKVAHQTSHSMLPMRGNHILLFSEANRKATIYNSITNNIVTEIPYHFISKDKQFHGQLTFEPQPIELPDNQIICQYIDHRFKDKKIGKTILWDSIKNTTLEVNNSLCTRYTFSNGILSCVSDEKIIFFDALKPIGTLSSLLEKKNFSDAIWMTPQEFAVLLNDGSIFFYKRNELNQFTLTQSTKPTTGSQHHFYMAKTKNQMLCCSQVNPVAFFPNLADYASAHYCQIKLLSTKDKSAIDYARIYNFFHPTFMPDEQHVMSVTQDRNLKYKIAFFNLETQVTHHEKPEYDTGVTQKALCFLENGRIITQLKNHLNKESFLVLTPRFILSREEKIITKKVHKVVDGLFKEKRDTYHTFPQDLARIVAEYCCRYR